MCTNDTTACSHNVGTTVSLLKLNLAQSNVHFHTNPPL